MYFGSHRASMEIDFYYYYYFFFQQGAVKFNIE